MKRSLIIIVFLLAQWVTSASAFVFDAQTKSVLDLYYASKTNAGSNNHVLLINKNGQPEFMHVTQDELNMLKFVLANPSKSHNALSNRNGDTNFLHVTEIQFKSFTNVVRRFDYFEDNFVYDFQVKFTDFDALSIYDCLWYARNALQMGTKLFEPQGNNATVYDLLWRIANWSTDPLPPATHTHPYTDITDPPWIEEAPQNVHVYEVATVVGTLYIDLEPIGEPIANTLMVIKNGMILTPVTEYTYAALQITLAVAKIPGDVFTIKFEKAP